MKRISAFMLCAVKHHKTLKRMLIKVPDMFNLIISSHKKPPKEICCLAADGRGHIWLVESASEGEFLVRSLFHTHVMNFITMCCLHQVYWQKQALKMQLKHHQSQQNPELGHLSPWMSALSSGLLKTGLHSSHFSTILRWSSLSIYLSPELKRSLNRIFVHSVKADISEHPEVKTTLIFTTFSA